MNPPVPEPHPDAGALRPTPWFRVRGFGSGEVTKQACEDPRQVSGYSGRPVFRRDFAPQVLPIAEPRLFQRSDQRLGAEALVEAGEGLGVEVVVSGRHGEEARVRIRRAARTPAASAPSMWPAASWEVSVEAQWIRPSMTGSS